MMTRRLLTCVCVSLLIVMLSGCGGQHVQWEQIKTLEREKTEQAMRADKLQQENETLRQQVDTLSGLDGDVRLAQLDTLAKIELSKYTGIYVKDKTSDQGALLVYVEPTDAQQDFVKAVGTLTIELWDLEAAPAQAKLAEWTLTPVQLQQHWGGNVFSSYYRLSFPIENILTGHEKDLTIKATFTDLLSGKVFRDQKTITD